LNCRTPLVAYVVLGLQFEFNWAGNKVRDWISFRIYLCLYASISFGVKDAMTLRAGDRNEVMSTPNPKCVEIIDATCSSLSVPCKRGADSCHHATFADSGEELLLSMTSISRK
jgi:hypothetical protein